MSNIFYKLATVEDFDNFYMLKCDPLSVKWSGFAGIPDKENLRLWYLNALQSEKRDIYILYSDAEAIGYFYLDKINDKRYEAAASGIIGSYCNMGLGTKTIEWREEIAKEKGADIIESWVSENNQYSYKRYIKRGWTKTIIYDIRDVRLAGGQQKFYKWEKSLR